MRGRTTVAAVVLLASSAAAARAQGAAEAARATTGGSEQPVEQISMDAAVRQAIDRNLTLVAERYSIDVAQARILTAKLRPNPVLTVNAMLPDRTLFDNAVSPREQMVRADVVLEGGGKRERRIAVAEQAKSVAELQFLNTMRGVVLDVESAFVDVLLARENVALARESLSAFNEIVNINTERVRTGDLSQVELSRSQLAALQFQNDVRQQEAKLVVARNKLKTLLGRTDAAPIEVAGDFRHEKAAVALDDVRRRALEQRPDLEALRRDNARSAADLRLQIAQGKIDYTLSAEYHRQHQPSPTDVFGNLLGLYVSVPLPIFNRNQGEVERARQEQKQTSARVTALQAEIAAEVASAYQDYASTREILDTIETQMLERARDVRTTTEYSYRRGEASFVEFLDAVRAFNETMQSYNQARADYARSLYALDSISGKVQP